MTKTYQRGDHMRHILLTASLFMVACQSQSDLIEDDFGPKPVAAIHADTLTLDTHIDIPLTYMREIDPSVETDSVSYTHLTLPTILLV